MPRPSATLQPSHPAVARLLRALAGLGLAVGAALIGPAAPAQTADEVRALQFALSHVPRYRPGPVDGIAGPQTEGAVDTYAGSRPMEGEFWIVAAHVEDLVWWRSDWTPEIERAVSETLVRAVRSGPVPKIRERRAFVIEPRGGACIRIGRGSNARWLHFSLVRTRIVSVPGAQPVPGWAASGPAPIAPEAAELWCRLGFIAH